MQRQRKAEITKNRIIESFLEILRFSRFEKTTIKLICEYAVISRSTFYQYFADKYVLLSESVKFLKDKYFETMFSMDYRQLAMQIANFCDEYMPIFQNLVHLQEPEVQSILLTTYSTALSTHFSTQALSNEEKEALLQYFEGGFTNLLFWNSDKAAYQDKEVMKRCFGQILRNIRFIASDTK